MRLKAPFPYFGGKRAVAGLVWRRLGDVRNFIEPFCGSAAVLLLRPHEPKVETVNDIDCLIANFWRALQHDSEATAIHADGPVNEADLHARHRWLVYGPDAEEFRGRMKTDPHYYDAQIAGWWVWGICMWIGGGWCKQPEWSERPALSRAGDGVHKGLKQQMPDTAGSSAGKGVHRKRPAIGETPGAAGIHGKRSQLCTGNTTAGPGVHRKLPNCDTRGVVGRPQLADAYSRGRGVHANDAAGTCAQRRAWLIGWFRQLQDRLRTVRVCCGDWQRVCGSRSVTTRLGMTGVFLDPPYSAESGRGGDLYAEDDLAVAHRVRAWCLEHGGNPQMRIALCGLEGEHDELEQHGWEVEAWKSYGGYGNRGETNVNRERERIWFSPACLREPGLFTQAAETVLATEGTESAEQEEAEGGVSDGDDRVEPSAV